MGFNDDLQEDISGQVYKLLLSVDKETSAHQIPSVLSEEVASLVTTILTSHLHPPEDQGRGGMGSKVRAGGGCSGDGS